MEHGGDLIRLWICNFKDNFLFPRWVKPSFVCRFPLRAVAFNSYLARYFLDAVKLNIELFDVTTRCSDS